MTISILQWNMNGYLNHYKQLELLIKKYSPQTICLQETHLIPYRNFPAPINYTIYTLNSAVNASGSVAILVHNSIQHTEIHLPQDFELLCSRNHSMYTFNIICSYVAPRQHFTCNNLENVYSNLSTLTLTTGDFNSWHTLWGSPRKWPIHSPISFNPTERWFTHTFQHPQYSHTRRSHSRFCDPCPRIRLVYRIKYVWKRPLSYHHNTIWH